MIKSEYQAHRELLMAKQLADQRRQARTNPLRARVDHRRRAVRAERFWIGVVASAVLITTATLATLEILSHLN